MYTLVFTASYDRAYEKLPPQIQKKADQQIQRLRHNPYHPSLRTHKRRGEARVWQARITRDYWLYLQMEGNIITLTAVGLHEE